MLASKNALCCLRDARIDLQHVVGVSDNVSVINCVSALVPGTPLGRNMCLVCFNIYALMCSSP
jgi:hypothetical protein